MVDETPGGSRTMSVAGEVWRACAAKDHRRCPREVPVQAPWATRGDPPPTPDAKGLTVERCACPCHEVRA